MSDKFVKALLRQHKHPMKDRAKCAALGSGGLKDCGRSFKRFLLPSFPRPDSMVAIAGCQSARSEESLCFVYCFQSTSNLFITSFHEQWVKAVVILNLFLDATPIGAELNSA